MKKFFLPIRLGACFGTLTLVSGLLAGCSSEPNLRGGEPAVGPIGTSNGGSDGGNGSGGDGGGSVECTPSIQVASDSRAFVVTDPEILANFSLERVLQQMIDKVGNPSNTQTPLELLQRLFDTENVAAEGAFADVQHCDEFSFAFMNAAPTSCPRAEGALAKNPNLLTADDPNSFVPVAIVNRFDLTRTSGVTCGEYRIVYAKLSGKTNSDDRVLINVEASMPNPTSFDLTGCRPAAEFWAGLEKDTDIQVIADKLDKFFFTGWAAMPPAIHPDNCGDKGPDDDGAYGGSRGQVRVGHKMQTPWEWREFHLKRATTGTTTALNFVPVTVKNNPAPERFDVDATPDFDWFRQQFVGLNLASLSASSLHDIRMQSPDKSDLGQSAFEGVAAADYAAQGTKSPGNDFASALDTTIEAEAMVLPCPTITGKNILQRASVQTCAGCHAPQKFLDSGNSIGCGLTWPDSLGETHIDENSQLSPALKDVFLPRRAEVLSKFLGGCSSAAINAVLQPAAPGDGGIPK